MLASLLQAQAMHGLENATAVQDPRSQDIGDIGLDQSDQVFILAVTLVKRSFKTACSPSLSVVQG